MAMAVPEGFFGGGRIGEIALHQVFAAGAVEFRLERPISDTLACRQRFIEDGDRTVEVAGSRFGLGKNNFGEPVEEQDLLFAQKFDAATHALEPVARCAAIGRRHAFEKNPPRLPHRQIVLTREPGEFNGVSRGARVIVSHQREHGRMQCLPCACADVGEAGDPRLSVADERNRAFDLAERPQREREAKHRRDAGVLSEAERETVVWPGSKQGQACSRSFPRFEVLSGEPMRNSGRRGTQLRLRASRASPRRRSGTRRSVPSSQAARRACSCRPEAIVGCQSFRRVLLGQTLNSRALAKASAVSGAP